jgi:hypothetical protein
MWNALLCIQEKTDTTQALSQFVTDFASWLPPNQHASLAGGIADPSSGGIGHSAKSS